MKMKKVIAMLGAAAVILLVGVLLWVRGDVRDTAARAQSLFPGDRVEALTALALSEEHSLEDRNRAVWALSHVGDARALPTLEQLKTDAPCDHARHVCQYELLKALSASRGEKFRPFSILNKVE